VAAVDMGSNSVRLLVADVVDGRLEEVRRLLRITRLGQGVDRERRLGAEPMERTLAVVREYADLARRDGATTSLLTGTSAVRDATNGRAFLDRLTRETGFPARLLSGTEEARTAFRGVTAGRGPLAAATAVVDVGGGSTEVVVGDASGFRSGVSVDAGAVRTTERWLVEGPVDAARLSAAREGLRVLFLTRVPDASRAVDGGIAVAGTATTLAAVDLGLATYDGTRIHGHVLPRGRIEELLDRLAPLDIPERRLVPGMEPGRAPTIVGGALCLLAAIDRLDLTEVEISDRDILHGVAAIAAGLFEP
jgi:exopolyphosphatase/guanosine-5'-triphosphate,3'-diphosphate pyrophosphatase